MLLAVAQSQSLHVVHEAYHRKSCFRNQVTSDALRVGWRSNWKMVQLEEQDEDDDEEEYPSKPKGAMLAPN